jgi:alkylhydroperoxidase/carboxymuconolactone decarboxylase family protein YurZ
MTEARAPTFNSKPEVQKMQKRKLGNSGLDVSACQKAQQPGGASRSNNGQTGWRKVTEEQYHMTTNPNTPANEDADAVSTVAPALERYTETTLSEVWKRPDLSARDRSLVTVAALIARNQAAQLSPYLNRAFDNGVKAA